MYTSGTKRPLICDFYYLINKELKDEGGYAAIDADEKVDGGEHHIGCAGHREHERGRVHQGSDRPTTVGQKGTRLALQYYYIYYVIIKKKNKHNTYYCIESVHFMATAPCPIHTSAVNYIF